MIYEFDIDVTCPWCGHEDVIAVETDAPAESTYIRHTCEACGGRYGVVLDENGDVIRIEGVI